MAKKFSIGQSLSQGMQEAMQIGLTHAGELHVEFIPINRLETDPENPREFAISVDDIKHGLNPTDELIERKRVELESIKSLCHSIKEHGVINPIIVYKYQDKYRLIAGERRTLASIMAGKETIPASIHERKPKELNITLIQWIENNEREDLTLWEKILNIKAIIRAYTQENGKEGGKISPKELSDLIGCSQPYAVSLSTVADAPEDVSSLIQKNRIKSIDKATVLSRIKNHSLRQKAIKACLAGASLDELRKYAGEDQSQKEEKNKKGGRPSVKVPLGASSHQKVVLFVIKSIADHPKLNNNSELSDLIQELKKREDDPKHIASVFKGIIRFLEKNQNIIS